MMCSLFRAFEGPWPTLQRPCGANSQTGRDAWLVSFLLNLSWQEHLVAKELHVSEEKRKKILRTTVERAAVSCGQMYYRRAYAGR